MNQSRFHKPAHWAQYNHRLSLVDDVWNFGKFHLLPGQLQGIWSHIKALVGEDFLYQPPSHHRPTPDGCLGRLTEDADHCLRLLFGLLTPDAEREIVDDAEQLVLHPANHPPPPVPEVSWPSHIRATWPTLGAAIAAGVDNVQYLYLRNNPAGHWLGSVIRVILTLDLELSRYLRHTSRCRVCGEQRVLAEHAKRFRPAVSATYWKWNRETQAHTCHTRNCFRVSISTNYSDLRADAAYWLYRSFLDTWVGALAKGTAPQPADTLVPLPWHWCIEFPDCVQSIDGLRLSHPPEVALCWTIPQLASLTQPGLPLSHVDNCIGEAWVQYTNERGDIVRASLRGVDFAAPGELEDYPSPASREEMDPPEGNGADAEGADPGQFTAAPMEGVQADAAMQASGPMQVGGQAPPSGAMHPGAAGPSQVNALAQLEALLDALPPDQIRALLQRAAARPGGVRGGSTSAMARAQHAAAANAGMPHTPFGPAPSAGHPPSGPSSTAQTPAPGAAGNPLVQPLGGQDPAAPHAPGADAAMPDQIPDGTHAHMSAAQEEALLQDLQRSLHFEPSLHDALVQNPFMPETWYAPNAEGETLEPPPAGASMMNNKALMKQVELYSLIQKFTVKHQAQDQVIQWVENCLNAAHTLIVDPGILMHSNMLPPEQRWFQPLLKSKSYTAWFANGARILKDAFRQRFCHDPRSPARIAFDTLDGASTWYQRQRTVAEYVSTFNDLLRRANMMDSPGPILCNFFLNGLSPSMRDLVVADKNGMPWERLADLQEQILRKSRVAIARQKIAGLQNKGLRANEYAEHLKKPRRPWAERRAALVAATVAALGRGDGPGPKSKTALKAELAAQRSAVLAALSSAGQAAQSGAEVAARRSALLNEVAQSSARVALARNPAPGAHMKPGFSPAAAPGASQSFVPLHDRPLPFGRHQRDREITEEEASLPRQHFIELRWGVDLVNGQLHYHPGCEDLNDYIRPLLRRWDICFNCRGTNPTRHTSDECQFRKSSCNRLKNRNQPGTSQHHSQLDKKRRSNYQR